MVTETDSTAHWELLANHFMATKASLISMAVRHDTVAAEKTACSMVQTLKQAQLK